MSPLQSHAPSEKPSVAPHALIGILAVFLAAMNSSLGGGLIGAGLEDLRGVWGLDLDAAVYIPTSFNAAQMFMGPLSIILAARYGHRRVLLYAGGIYILSSLLLPLMPPRAIVLILLVIGGLASGTFYPLALSFISRNLPVQLIPFGIAAYTMDLIGSNHIVHALEGFFIDYWSWKWIFWTPAILTLPMLLCVKVGIPVTPRDQLLPKCIYGEMLYVSGGLTMLYIALDQGERLDWFNNGLINGLLLAGIILLVIAVLKRRMDPYLVLDFSYLKSRNILILGLLVFIFRVVLLRVVALIPLFLETLQHYRPPEIGHLLSFSLIPFLVALTVIADLLRRVHVRLVLIAGFFILAVINFYDSHALSTWIGDDFIIQQMVGAVAICMAILGTFSGVVFEGRITGAYRNRAGAYCQGAFFQVVRLFGGQLSASGLRRFIQVRDHFWQTKLVSGLQSGWQFDGRLAHLGTALAPQAAGPLQRPEIAAGLIAGSVKAQAFTLAIDDSFMLLALLSAVAVLAVFMMTPIPLPHQLPDAAPTKT
ncbi:MAG: MFS transporter [Candidatus Obscuribacterales bacterium]|nr:MFS transporter [Candidatus Obscuribacterales bacterium]